MRPGPSADPADPADPVAGGVPGRGTRMAVRAAFGAVAAVFALQVLLIGGGAGEPYPGVIMPGFVGSGGYADGAVRMERMEAVLVHKGGESVFSQRRLLDPYPDSHHGTLALSFLSPPRADPRPLRDWLRRNGLPGLAAGRTDRRAGCVDAGVREWARGRAAALLPGVPVRRMEIRWYADTFRPGGSGPAAREPLGVLPVPLEGGGTCAR